MSANNKWMAAAILALFFWASVQAQDVEVIKVNVAVVTVNVNVSDGKGHPPLKPQSRGFSSDRRRPDGGTGIL